MSDRLKRRPGPKPSGRPRKMNIGFSATPEDHAWLTALPNRSAWLAAHIAADRAAQHETGSPIGLNCAADRAPSAPDAPREAS